MAAAVFSRDAPRETVLRTIGRHDKMTSLSGQGTTSVHHQFYLDPDIDYAGRT